MTEGYLRGAVSQYKASKKNFLSGTNPFWDPETCKNTLR